MRRQDEYSPALMVFENYNGRAFAPLRKIDFLVQAAVLAKAQRTRREARLLWRHKRRAKLTAPLCDGSRSDNHCKADYLTLNKS
jgi:hypothetical protein